MNSNTLSLSIYKNNKQIKISSQYQTLETFVKEIPNTFDQQGEIIHSGRNLIKIIDVNSEKVNVKRYAIPPYFFNRIIYVLFRETKAKRSYDYALKLNSLGIDSPHQ